MNTYSARQVAVLAGTTAPRVLRTARALGFEVGEAGRARHKRQFDAEQTQALLARLVAFQPAPIAGLRASEAHVLAALAGAPLGLTSARAVARAAGLSPATASVALTRLTARGLVCRQSRLLAEGGARERDVLTVDVAHPEWAALSPKLREFRLARKTALAPGRRGPVPARLGHVFWNEDLRTLDPDRHGSLIAKRVLQARDPQALAWAASRLSGQDWERAAQARGTDRRDAAVARILAQVAVTPA